ncbi:hypothetical protein B0H34DRAFT_810983 [Crassisporium funariophilum]|nr:hypothetical protein B0H34DRAFT_810983 [Crassisporium funariophilum]
MNWLATSAIYTRRIKRNKTEVVELRSVRFCWETGAGSLGGVRRKSNGMPRRCNVWLEVVHKRCQDTAPEIARTPLLTTSPPVFPPLKSSINEVAHHGTGQTPFPCIAPSFPVSPKISTRFFDFRGMRSHCDIFRLESPDISAARRAPSTFKLTFVFWRAEQQRSAATTDVSSQYVRAVPTASYNQLATPAMTHTNTIYTKVQSRRSMNVALYSADRLSVSLLLIATPAIEQFEFSTCGSC